MAGFAGFKRLDKRRNDEILSVSASPITIPRYQQACRILLPRFLLAFVSITTLLYLTTRPSFRNLGLITWRHSQGHNDYDINSPSYPSTHHSLSGTEDESPEFIWSTIRPATVLNLTFTPCYPNLYSGKLQCARLLVPLSYQEQQSSFNVSNATVAIALLLLPAPVPPTHPQHGGPILLNPGGPGGSGIDMLLQSGQNLQTIINPPLAHLKQQQPGHQSKSNSGAQKSNRSKQPRYFDLLGFDPRGLRRSTPSIQCFPDDDDGFARTLWQVADEAEGLLGSAFSPEGNEEVLRRKWVRALTLARGCSRAGDDHDEDEDILAHVNTTPVAADMLSIVDAYSSFKKRQLSKEEQSLSNSAEKEEPAKLNLFAVSYGTALGAMFAAMYPSRVGRFILDGVVDAEDYFVYAGNLQTSLVDADRIFDYFLTECVRVGVEGGCAFAALAYGPGTMEDPHGNGNENKRNGTLAIEELRHKYEEIIERMKRTGGIGASLPFPISSPSSSPGHHHHIPSPPLDTEVTTPTDLEILTRIALYQPAKTFRFFAQVLADLAIGNATLLAQFKQNQRRDRWVDLSSHSGSSSSSTLRPAAGRRRRLDVRNGFEANLAILCSETPRSIIHRDRNQDHNQDQKQETNEKEEEEQQAFEKFKDYYTSIKNQSHYLGDYWATLRLGCIGWEKEAKWRVDLTPFFDNTSSSSSSSSVNPPTQTSKKELRRKPTKKKGKILYISQAFDPVTPYANAVKMAKRFHPPLGIAESEAEGKEGERQEVQIESTVLKQINGVGHSSFSARSVCKARAVRAWFQDDYIDDDDDVDSELNFDGRQEGENEETVNDHGQKVHFKTCPIEGGVFDGGFDEHYDNFFCKDDVNHDVRKNDDDEEEEKELRDALTTLFLSGFGSDGGFGFGAVSLR